MNRIVFQLDFYRSEMQISKASDNLDPTGFDAFPLSFYHSNPSMDIQIMGKTFSLLIDSGNPGVFLSLNNKERAHFKSVSDKIFNWKTLRERSVFDTVWTKKDEKIDAFGLLNVDVRVGKYNFAEAYLKFNAQPINQVGLQFLQYFGKVIFDYANATIYLAKPIDKPSINELFNIGRYVNSHGVVFSNDSVRKVIAISPKAETLGIKLQDTLLELRGRDIRKEFDSGDGWGMSPDVMLDNYYYAMNIKSSSVTLQSDTGLKRFVLKRDYPLTRLPDTVQSFGFYPSFQYLASKAIQIGNYVEYKVRPLPKDILD